MPAASLWARIAPRLALLALGLAACTERVNAPEMASTASIAGAVRSDRIPGETTSGVARWNLLACQLVAAHQIAPPKAARILAYLSVAADHAARVAGDEDDDDFGDDPAGEEPGQRAAIREASYRILSYLLVTELGFAGDAALLDAERAAQEGRRDAANRGWELRGQRAADALIIRARSDRADLAWTGTVPIGPSFWIGTSPQLPVWGKLQPWFMRSGDQFRAPPPPAFGSARFVADRNEVRTVSDTRTPEQLRIAMFWADGAGTVTPPGHWNQIATDLIAAQHLNERKAAHALALMNMAISDAVVGCWDSKYTYWVIRPYQADALITTPIGRPPHPSYPSGHACSSNAAAGVLGYLFPHDRAGVDAMATESALSRIYGGIHYRFDIEAGKTLGRSVAALAIATERKRLHAD